MSAWERFLECLERYECNPRGSGDKREFCCPLHNDRRASASATVGSDGRILVLCHVCGPDRTEEILACVGLSFADLYPEGSARNGREIVATYPYVDEAEALLYEVVRYTPKGFKQRQPDGNGGWLWHLRGARRVLYRLPRVLAAVEAGETVWIAEGEADVHALERAGVVATCNPGGAGKWRDAYNKALNGADVVVVVDLDDPGHAHAEAVAAALQGVARSVRIVRAATGKDASDHLAAGRTLDEFGPVGASMGDDRESEPGRRVELTPASAIPSERVRWLWDGRLPLRSLSVVAGEKGLGKSTLTNARLVAEATRGTLHGELQGQPIDVLVCTAEDDWASVVKPRLMVHHADLARVHRVTVHDDTGRSLLTLPEDVPQLEAQIERLRKSGRVVGMFVLDPIGAFLSQGTDTHRDASVRRVLAPLAAMAESLDLVVIVVAHLTKDESSRLINRVSGAGAFVNAARSVLVLARSPDDPDGEQGHERVLVHVSSNWGRLAPSLAATVEAREAELDDGSRSSVGYLNITGETDIGVEDLQRGDKDESSSVDVEEAILAALEYGERASLEAKATVTSEVGCSKRTVERAAIRMEERGEISIFSGGFPRKTTWALGSGDTEAFRSSDTAGPGVATSTNTRRVATGNSGVVTGDSASSSDTGDCLGSTVATDRQERIGAAAQAVNCCCADGGERGDDGRCGRCYGRVGVIELQDGGAA